MNQHFEEMSAPSASLDELMEWDASLDELTVNRNVHDEHGGDTNSQTATTQGNAFLAGHECEEVESMCVPAGIPQGSREDVADETKTSSSLADEKVKGNTKADTIDILEWLGKVCDEDIEDEELLTRMSAVRPQEYFEEWLRDEWPAWHKKFLDQQADQKKHK